MIYLGADHRGFALKEQVAAWLSAWEKEYEDLGAKSLDPDDDYPVYAEKVAKAVSQHRAKGVLICGSGVGVDVAANKVDGVRASIGKTADQVKAGRKDDDFNVLVLAADYTSLSEARKMLMAFLETGFSEKPRYKKRLQAIKKLEEEN